MARPKLETPHVCSTPGCAGEFTTGGKVNPLPLCPRCYTRARRGSQARPAIDVPTERVHLSLRLDTLQRARAYLCDSLLDGNAPTLSSLVNDAVVAFLNETESRSAGRTAQGKRR